MPTGIRRATGSWPASSRASSAGSPLRSASARAQAPPARARSRPRPARVPRASSGRPTRRSPTSRSRGSGCERRRAARSSGCLGARGSRDEPVRLVDVPPVLAQRGVREQRPLPASVRDLLLGVDDHHGEAAAARLDVLADPEEQAARDAPGDAPALRVIGEVDLGRQAAPREGGGRWGRLRAPRHVRDTECRQEPVERRVAREPALQANERAPHRGLLG